jgi:hypothetical protein
VKEAVVSHFRKWLRTGTGCGFAASLANGGRIAYEAHDEMPPVHELDTNLDEYAKKGLSAIIVFPFVTTEAALVEVLSALRAGTDRWKVRRRGDGASGTVHIGVDWRTSTGDTSDAMGFGPLPSMPVPRRAPYFAIGTWPGGYSNPRRGIPPTPPARNGRVSFLDVVHGLDADAYTNMWTATQGAVTDLMTLPADDASRYRRVAFALSVAACNAITFDP